MEFSGPQPVLLLLSLFSFLFLLLFFLTNEQLILWFIRIHFFAAKEDALKEVNAVLLGRLVNNPSLAIILSRHLVV
jgi:hypothetical protein